MKKITKLKFLIIFVIAFIALLLGSKNVEARTNCTADDAINWVKSQLGKSIDKDGFPTDQPYQCVDLIMAYYQYLGGYRVSGNGADYSWNEVPSGWTRIQGAQPQKGDILVYTNDTYGHVAIYESDYSTYHQNFNYHPYVEQVGYKYNALPSYWGVIRPDFKNNVPKITYIGMDTPTATANTMTAMAWVSDNSNVSSLQMRIWRSGYAADTGTTKNATYNSAGGFWEVKFTESDIKKGTSGVVCVDAWAYGKNGTKSENAGVMDFAFAGKKTGLGTFKARIVPKSNTTYCLGISETSSGSDVKLKTKSLTDSSQIWDITEFSDGSYGIVNSSTGLTLALEGGDSKDANGVIVELAKFNSSRRDQKFMLQTYNGGYRIVPINTGGVRALDIKDGTMQNNQTIEEWQTVNSANNAQTWIFEKIEPDVSYTTHVQNVGWQAYVKNGAMSGTSGKSLRIEGIKIKLTNMSVSGGIQYRTHVQNIGWQNWVSNDTMAGTSGKGLRLEAIQIKLTGEMANKYDVYYRVHAQEFGWLGWAKNGASAGTEGYSYRIEAIEIKLIEKGKTGPASTVSAFYNGNLTPSVNYTTHVQNIGWQSYVKDGAMSGTSGKSLRLEGIKVKLTNMPTTGGIQYRTHVQNIGWQSWVQNDTMAGTSGKSLRLEAIQIKLTGKMAEKYDVYYRVHAQNFGWLGWAKNGASAGTQGYSYRLEGIQIKLVKKGSAAPGSTANAFKTK